MAEEGVDVQLIPARLRRRFSCAAGSIVGVDRSAALQLDVLKDRWPRFTDIKDYQRKAD
jgi:hypothetical protein